MSLPSSSGTHLPRPDANQSTPSAAEVAFAVAQLVEHLQRKTPAEQVRIIELRQLNTPAELMGIIELQCLSEWEEFVVNEGFHRYLCLKATDDEIIHAGSQDHATLARNMKEEHLNYFLQQLATQGLHSLTLCFVAKLPGRDVRGKEMKGSTLPGGNMVNWILGVCQLLVDREDSEKCQNRSWEYTCWKYMLIACPPIFKMRIVHTWAVNPNGLRIGEIMNGIRHYRENPNIPVWGEVAFDFNTPKHDAVDEQALPNPQGIYLRSKGKWPMPEFHGPLSEV